MPAFSYAVAREVLEAEPTPDAIAHLRDGELERLLDALIEIFRAWRPPQPGFEGEYRLCTTVGPFEQAPPLSLGTAGLLAHTVVLRDPLEEWANGAAYFPTSRKDRAQHRSLFGWDVEELSSAFEFHRRHQACVDSGVVLLAPYPADMTYWGTRDIELEHGGQLPLGTWDVIADPDVARCALGRLPVSSEAWPAVAFEGESGDDEFDAAYRWEGWERFNSTVEDVEIAIRPHLARALHAAHAGARVAPVSELERLVWRSGLFEAAEARDTNNHQRATDVVSRISLPRFDRLTPSDLAAIRESSEGFKAWRDWLGDVCTRAHLLAADDTGALRTEVAESLDRAIREIEQETSVRSRLREYKRGELHGDLLALTAGISVAGGTSTPWPLLAPAAKTAHSLLRRTLLRPAPKGWKGVLWSLSKI